MTQSISISNVHLILTTSQWPDEIGQLSLSNTFDWLDDRQSYNGEEWMERSLNSERQWIRMSFQNGHQRRLAYLVID